MDLKGLLCFECSDVEFEDEFFQNFLNQFLSASRHACTSVELERRTLLERKVHCEVNGDDKFVLRDVFFVGILAIFSIEVSSASASALKSPLAAR